VVLSHFIADLNNSLIAQPINTKRFGPPIYSNCSHRNQAKLHMHMGKLPNNGNEDDVHIELAAHCAAGRRRASPAQLAAVLFL